MWWFDVCICCKMTTMIEFPQIPPHWGFKFQTINFGGHIDIQSYHAPRPTVSIYSNILCYIKGVVHWDGIRSADLIVVDDTCEGSGVEAALGRGSLRTVVHVCSVSWLVEEPCGSIGRGGLSRQKWPESVLLLNAVSLLPPWGWIGFWNRGAGGGVPFALSASSLFPQLTKVCLDLCVLHNTLHKPASCGVSIV